MTVLCAEEVRFTVLIGRSLYKLLLSIDLGPGTIEPLSQSQCLITLCESRVYNVFFPMFCSIRTKCNWKGRRLSGHDVDLLRSLGYWYNPYHGKGKQWCLSFQLLDRDFLISQMYHLSINIYLSLYWSITLPFCECIYKTINYISIFLDLNLTFLIKYIKVKDQYV